MTAGIWIALIVLALNIGAIVWHQGRTAEQNRQTQARAKEWSDGLGKLCRAIDGKQERRWKHLLAAEIEISATRGDAEAVKRLADLLRHDAYRD